MGTTSATCLFNFYHQEAPHKIVRNDLWPILTRFLIIYAWISSFKSIPRFGTCWPGQNCHPPSCAQNVLSLLRRATGTDKKGNHPLWRQKYFWSDAINPNRGIYLPVCINQASKSGASCKRSIGGNIWTLCTTTQRTTTTPLLSLKISQSRSLLSLDVTILLRGRKLSTGD